MSLEITVLLMNFTASASCIDTPPPSHPATLLAMMLLVTVTLFHPGLRKAWGPLVIGFGPLGNATTSSPLTICRRRPPPVPLSALLPMIRLASITRLRPVPSGRPGWAIQVVRGAAFLASVRASGEHAIRRGAQDCEAAAVGGYRRAGGLVEQDPVVRDDAVVAEARVRHPARVARAQVAADPVVFELVAVGTRAEADATGGRRRARIQRVADRRIARDRVVVHVHVRVDRLAELGADLACRRVPGTESGSAPPAMSGSGNSPRADGDAARERAVIGGNPRVGDLQIVVPAVHEDRAAALRAVDDAETVDARRIAHEVAGAVVDRGSQDGGRSSVSCNPRCCS